MDSTATLTIKSRFEAGKWLAVRQIVDGGATTIFLAQDYDDALLRTHLNRHPSNVYRVHQPSEYGGLRRLLAQFRSQWRNRPQYLHALLRREHRHITEFRSQGIWVFKAGHVPVSAWESSILAGTPVSWFHLGPTATHAMISAWLDAVGCFGFSKRIDWNRKEDAVYTDVMDVLAIAGLIDCRSGAQDTETVTALRFHPFVVAKFSEVAFALVQSDITGAEADEILTSGLWNFWNDIQKKDPTAMAREFATAWYHEKSTAATEAE